METDNKKDDGGADYRSDPHADLGWSDGRGHDGCVARCFGLEIQCGGKCRCDDSGGSGNF